MKSFDGILLCSDLDGTLFRADKSISSENLDAIRRFKEKGGRFTFITGRVPTAARGVFEAVRPNAPVGCLNGGGVFDFERDEFLRFRELDRSVLEMVAAVDREVPEAGIQMNTGRRVYFNKENEAMRRFRAVTGLPNLTCHYTEVKEPLAKALFLHMEDAVIERVAARLRAHPLYERFDYIRSEETIYEILPKGISKGTALMEIAEICGIDPRRTIAVGDFDNDVSMLRSAGLGIAVANASDAAKRAATLLTVSNEENAIAHIVCALEDGRIVI